MLDKLIAAMDCAESYSAGDKHIELFLRRGSLVVEALGRREGRAVAAQLAISLDTLDMAQGNFAIEALIEQAAGLV